jgi:hypothetical protein
MHLPPGRPLAVNSLAVVLTIFKKTVTVTLDKGNRYLHRGEDMVVEIGPFYA